MLDKANIKTSWDLSGLLSGDNDPIIEQTKEAIANRNKAFVAKWKDRTDYLEDPAVLKEALDEFEVMESEGVTGGKVGYYFWLRRALDQEATDLKALANKMDEFGVKQANDLSFFMHRISKIAVDKQDLFLNSPELVSYKHLLESSFKDAKYLLSEEEEKILNLMMKPAYSNWVEMTEEFLSREEAVVLDEDGKETKKVFSELSSLMSNKNKQVRDSAASAFNVILQKYVDVAERELNSVLEVHKTVDDLRKITRPDFLTLLGDDIEPEVVDALLESVEKSYDISARFYELKAKFLGQEKLEYHERNVEIGDNSETIPFEKGLEIVSDSFKKLDTSFLDIFETFLKEGRIDVYPNKGKENGGFCVDVAKALPTFVLLNYTGRIQDVTTLAHEMGHAINDTLIKTKQNSLNCGTSVATAEVASTFMEDFSLMELSKEMSEETRLNLNMLKINDDISSIVRQVACYKFEQALHTAYREKGYLSKEEIGALFSKHMHAYMGDFVEQTTGCENWWVYWMHIRRFFYVYSYASGLLISKSLQNMVRQNPKDIEKVKEFLSAGTSESPRATFLKMGIDIADKSFWDKGLNEISALLDETWALAKKLNKI